MSQENVEIVRRIYDEGLIDQDPDDWLIGLATPDIEYVNPPHAIEPGVRRGPAAVARAMRAFGEVWEGSRHELHELFDCGDIVVAAVSWHTRSRGSASELVQEEAHSWSLRKGRIARFEWGQDVEAALEAGGAPALGSAHGMFRVIRAGFGTRCSTGKVPWSIPRRRR